MGTSDEIERIIVELEEQGAGNAYVAVKRLDDVMGDLAKKRPADFLEGFRALENALSKSLVDLPNMAALTDQAANAWQRLVGEVRRYNDTQVKKAMRNTDIESARRDAQQLAEQMRAANRIPTELQAASNPKSIDFAAALEAQSRKAGSAIEAAAHSAMEEAVAIGEAAKNASKLSSVYDVIEKRAKAAAKADADWLADKMRAANRIPTELQAASNPKALTGGQKFFQAVGRTFGPRSTQGLVSSVEALEKIGPIAGKIGPPLVTAAAAAGAIGIGLSFGAMHLAKEGAKSVIRAQAYREDVEEAFKTVERARLSQQNKETHLGKSGTQLTSEALGSSKKLLSMSNQIADDIGVAREQVAGQTLDFTTKGFDSKGAKRAILSIADLGTIDQRAGSEAGREGLTKVFGKIKATGRLNMDVLSELNTFGLEQGDVMTEIGKMLGKKDTDVLKMLSSSGGIRGLDLEPVYRAIEKQTGGGAGTAAIAKADRDMSKLIDRFHAIPRNILFDLEVGPGMEGAKDTLRSIIDWFDPEKGKGKEVRQVAGDLFNAIIEGLTGNKVDTKKGITGTLDAMLVGAREAVPVVRDLAGGVREIAGMAGGLMRVGSAMSEWGGVIGNIGAAWKGLTLPTRILMAPMTAGLSMLPELYQGFRGVGALIGGDTAGAMARFRNMLPGGEFADKFVGSMSGAFESMFADMRKGASDMYQSAILMGQNLWQGLVQGIQGGIGAVTQSATNLANSALSAVGVTWRVGSPARAFEDQSLWATAGSARGFERGTPSVVSAAEQMANAALGASWATGPANVNAAGALAMSSGGGGGVVIHFSPTIIVPGANSPTQAQAIGAAAVRGSREAFEAQLGTGLRRLRYG